MKIPRWDLQKFRGVSQKLGSSMKSVGEVMAIGRRFEEAFQKALRMLEIGVLGLAGNPRLRFEDLDADLREPTHLRVFAVAEAFKRGFSVDRIHQLTAINPWFLCKLRNIVDTADRLSVAGNAMPRELLLEAKQFGFSDTQIAEITHGTETEIRSLRERLGITPHVKQIDTLAAEYPAQTNYLYLTYNGSEDDVCAAGGSLSWCLVQGPTALAARSSLIGAPSTRCMRCGILVIRPPSSTAILKPSARITTNAIGSTSRS